ncbi:9912_t:CDS:2, partial [Gigaspora margarita]
EITNGSLSLDTKINYISNEIVSSPIYFSEVQGILVNIDDQTRDDLRLDFLK